MCRRIVLGLLALLALAVAGLLYAYYDVTRATPQVAKIPPGPPTPVEQQTAKRTLERLNRAVQAPPAAPRAARRGAAAPSTPAPQPMEIRLTEAELNAMIRGLPNVRSALQQARVDDLSLRFEPGRLVAEARVPIPSGAEARVSAAGRIGAENGQLTYETESVNVGSFPAPPPLRDALDQQLRAAVEQLNRGVRGNVENVDITDEALEVQVTPRPARPRGRRR